MSIVSARWQNPDVKTWEELSERGKLGRMRALALRAVEQYDVEVSKLSVIGGFTNALFRVDTPVVRSRFESIYSKIIPKPTTTSNLTGWRRSRLMA